MPVVAAISSPLFTQEGQSKPCAGLGAWGVGGRLSISSDRTVQASETTKANPTPLPEQAASARPGGPAQSIDRPIGPAAETQSCLHPT